MQLPGAADDGIDGTSHDALHATDTGLLIDCRDGIFGQRRKIVMVRRSSQQFFQFPDGDGATGRAQVDGGASLDDSLGVRPAARITAIATLRLREQGIYLDDLFFLLSRIVDTCSRG